MTWEVLFIVRHVRAAIFADQDVPKPPTPRRAVNNCRLAGKTWRKLHWHDCRLVGNIIRAGDRALQSGFER